MKTSKNNYASAISARHLHLTSLERQPKAANLLDISFRVFYKHDNYIFRDYHVKKKLLGDRHATEYLSAKPACCISHPGWKRRPIVYPEMVDFAQDQGGRMI